MVAAALTLGATVTAWAQDTPTAADTVALDSVFRRAGTVLRWNVVARELVGRQLARQARDARPDRPAGATFYDGNNNTRLYALVSGAQYDALRAMPDPRDAASAAATAAAAVLRTVFADDRTYVDRELAAERSRPGADALGAARARSVEAAGRRAARRWSGDAAAELRAPPWRGRIPSGTGALALGRGPSQPRHLVRSPDYRWRGCRSVPGFREENNRRIPRERGLTCHVHSRFSEPQFRRLNEGDISRK